jgi:hypothetical protein
MGFYRIRLLDEDGRLTHSSLFTCHSNEGACALASTMLQAGARADIWHEQRKIGSVGAQRPSDLGSYATNPTGLMTCLRPSRCDPADQTARTPAPDRSRPQPRDAQPHHAQPRHSQPRQSRSRVDAGAFAVSG